MYSVDLSKQCCVFLYGKFEISIQKHFYFLQFLRFCILLLLRSAFRRSSKVYSFPFAMSDQESENVDKKPVVIKNATDLQRLKLDKLMKNPEKPVVIPDPPKQKSLAPAPDFVRNVMGSSAGAGSGEFHVYRHLRRKEYSRQKFIQEKSEKVNFVVLLSKCVKM